MPRLQFWRTARRFVATRVERLKKEQKPDGGWEEFHLNYPYSRPSGGGSNAFATGQVLYAFEDLTITADKQMMFTVLLKDGRFVLERAQR